MAAAAAGGKDGRRGAERGRRPQSLSLPLPPDSPGRRPAAVPGSSRTPGLLPEHVSGSRPSAVKRGRVPSINDGGVQRSGRRRPSRADSGPDNAAGSQGSSHRSSEASSGDDLPSPSSMDARRLMPVMTPNAVEMYKSIFSEEKARAKSGSASHQLRGFGEC